MTKKVENPVSFPNGLVRSVIDNEQVVVKTYRIRFENKNPSSVVNGNLYIIIDEQNLLQTEERFAPNNWLFSEPTDVQTKAFMAMNYDKFNDIFRI